MGLLFVYGLNFLYMTCLSFHLGSHGSHGVVWLAKVTAANLQRNVCRRALIEAVARLDYPPDRLQIQVLMISTDETAQIAASCV
jgi:hypothetical protein